MGQRFTVALIVFAGLAGGGALLSVPPADAADAALLSPVEWVAPVRAAELEPEPAAPLEIDRSPLRERFAEAQALLSDRDFTAAAAAFEALAEDDALLADHWWHLAGTAWLSAKVPDLAAAALAHVPPGSARWLDAQWLRIRAHEEQGELPVARALLQPLHDGTREVGPWTRARALERAALLADREGDRDEARALWLAVWAQHPATGHATRAARHLRRTGFPPLARAERADALSNLHRHDEARAEARRVHKAVKLPDPAACLARFVEGKLLRKERRHTAAVEALAPVVAQCDDAALRPRALYLLATSEGILSPAAGRERWARLSADHPDHPFADDAAYFAAELSLRLGDDARALAELDALVAHHPDGEFAGEAWFRRFWTHFRAGNLAGAHDAAAAYEAATRRRALFAHRARALYWLGRASAAAGRAEDADRAFAALLHEHPTTLYALWAEERLGARAAALLDDMQDPRTARAVTAARSLGADPAWAAALELHQMGVAEAEGAFRRVDLYAHPPEAAVAAFDLLRAEGLGRAARFPEALVRPALQGPLDASNRALWEAHRPAAYRELLEGAAAQAGVDPDLFRGLVHRESRFQPRARSGAGALGLAQVMPATAREELQGMGLRLRDPADLYDPQLNARVGAGYLGKLLRLYDGRPELALAAYNGGMGRVNRWWGARATDDVDVFVESIPIDETREYVKKVMESYAAYRALRRHERVAAALPPAPTEG